MSVYMIIENLEVLDKDTALSYVTQAKPIIESLGGKYLVSTENVIPLSGNWHPNKIIMIEFKDMETLENCFGSDEYKKIIPLREKSLRGKTIVVESL